MDADADNLASAVFCFVNGNADTAATHGSCFGSICTITDSETDVTNILCVRSSWSPTVASFIPAANPASDLLFTQTKVASTMPEGI